MTWIKKIVYSWLIGAVLLTPLDWLQIRYEIIEFKSPVFFKTAWWVPVAFGMVFVFMALIFPILEETLTATFTFRHRYVFIEFLAIICAFLGPIFTQHYPYLIVFVLGIYVLFRLGFFHAKWDWLFFLIGALLGPTIEVILINTDLYRFSDPAFLGIPYWLPLMWGIVTMSGRRIAYVVEDLSKD